MSFQEPLMAPPFVSAENKKKKLPIQTVHKHGQTAISINVTDNTNRPAGFGREYTSDFVQSKDVPKQGGRRKSNKEPCVQGCILCHPF